MLRWRSDESLEIYARVSDRNWDKWVGASFGARVDSSIVPRLRGCEDFTPAQEQAFLSLAHSLLGADLNATRPDTS